MVRSLPFLPALVLGADIKLRASLAISPSNNRGTCESFQCFDKGSREGAFPVIHILVGDLFVTLFQWDRNEQSVLAAGHTKQDCFAALLTSFFNLLCNIRW